MDYDFSCRFIRGDTTFKLTIVHLQQTLKQFIKK